ncbi:MAG: tripartite tricarboxylate transporter substrate binding protein [Betaproteobacteria bacterium]|nr:tripartite tricarboxylate transporter substrate binding protein [Betaproteobacteria bacterium]
MNSPGKLLAAWSIGIALACTNAFAQSYPAKAVHVIIPVSPGGLQDSLARAMAPELARRWGHSVIVENRTGANGIISADAVAKAPPDGHMIWMGTMVQLSNDLLNRKMPFDPIKDLAPVIGLVEAGSMFVSSMQFPARNLAELVAAARAKPGEINYGSFGIGSLAHIDAEALARVTGIQVTHVPYKGGADILQAILAGQVTFGIMGITATIPLVRQGRIRAIAYGGQKRSSAFPDVPTISEAGAKGFVSGGWFGWFTTGGTPAVVINKIANDSGQVISAPDFRDKYVHAAGLEVFNLGPGPLAEQLRADRESYSVRLKALNVKLE